MTKDEQRMLESFRQLPNWAKPVLFRAGIRLMNKVPLAKVKQRAFQEFAAAQAKQEKLAGEARS